MKKVVFLLITLLCFITSCKVESDDCKKNNSDEIIEIEKIEKALEENINSMFFIFNKNKISIEFHGTVYFSNTYVDFCGTGDDALNGILYDSQYLGKNRYKLHYNVSDSNVIFIHPVKATFPSTIKEGELFITLEFDGEKIKLIKAEQLIFSIYHETFDYGSDYPEILYGVYTFDIENNADILDF